MPTKANSPADLPPASHRGAGVVLVTGGAAESDCAVSGTTSAMRSSPWSGQLVCPDRHSAKAIASRLGTKSVDRRATQAVPLVAIQANSASLVGGGFIGSAPGGAPSR